MSNQTENVTKLVRALMNTLHKQYPDPDEPEGDLAVDPKVEVILGKNRGFIRTLTKFYTEVNEINAGASRELKLNFITSKYLIQNVFNRYKLFELLIALAPANVGALFAASKTFRYFAVTKGVAVFALKSETAFTKKKELYFASYEDFNLPTFKNNEYTIDNSTWYKAELKEFSDEAGDHGKSSHPIEITKVDEEKVPGNKTKFFQWEGNGHVLPKKEIVDIRFNPNIRYINVYIKEQTEGTGESLIYGVNIHEKNWGVDVMQTRRGLTSVQQEVIHGDTSEGNTTTRTPSASGLHFQNSFKKVGIELLNLTRENGLLITNVKVIVEFPLSMANQDIMSHVTTKADPSFNILITGCT